MPKDTPPHRHESFMRTATTTLPVGNSDVGQFWLFVAWITLIAVVLFLDGFVCDKAGYQRGHRHGYNEGYAAAMAEQADSKSTMDAVGVCRWAHIAAGCPLPPGETMTNGLQSIEAWRKAHEH